MRKTTVFIRNVGEINILEINEIEKHRPTRNQWKLIQEHYRIEDERLEQFNLSDKTIDETISILLGIDVDLINKCSIQHH